MVLSSHATFALLCALCGTAEGFLHRPALHGHGAVKRSAAARTVTRMVVDPSDALAFAHNFLADAASAPEPSYSKASYYTTLSLYALSFPGLLSQIRRSVKSEPKTRVFEIPGPEAEAIDAVGTAARQAAQKALEEGTEAPKMTVGGKPLKETAAEIVAYFQANNYEVADADETITFRGLAGRSTSQVFFLTFITFLGLGSLGLVLSIQFPSIGNYWYALALLSPYAGIYYWQNASKENEAAVKLETTDDAKTTDITVRAEKEELDRFQEVLGYPIKGMEYVKGIFEQDVEA